jgi:hypothetical protein
MNLRGWFGGREIVRLPSSVKTVSDESAQALEEARRRRLQELGEWHPSGGWLIQPPGDSGQRATGNGQRSDDDLRSRLWLVTSH